MILTIFKHYANSFLKKYSIWVLCIVILLVLGGLAINQKPQESKTETQTIQSHAFESAALLPQAAIWHPAGENALLYQPYDDTAPTQLFWMEGIPQQWEAFPTGNSDNSAHLVWLNTDGKLWYSQINPDGSQKLLALSLASGNIHTMTTASLRNGGLAVVWQNEQSATGIMWIDTQGRKIAEQRLGSNVSHFDLTVNSRGMIYFTWASRQQVSILTFTPESIGEINVNNAHSFDLPIPFGEWLDTLRLLVDDEWVYVIWGINSAENPQATMFAVKAFPKSDIRTNVPLPETASSGLSLTPNDEPIPLRWVGEVQNWDESKAQLALTAYMDEQWIPVIINFADGAYTGYESLSKLPADASPPRVLIWDGQRTAAWVRINAEGLLIQEILH